MPSKKKKNEARKAKKEARRESEILLSAHARTSQADIFASGSEGRQVYDL